jgi:P-type Cu+ transporter
MERVKWKVEGMDCANCALTISKFLSREGAKDVRVNVIDGLVSFLPEAEINLPLLQKGIQSLGYHMAGEHIDGTPDKRPFLSTFKQKFLFCLPFTAVLMLHMLPLHHLSWFHALMNPWLQLGLCLPVFIVGMLHFGRSAFKSLVNGVPNMNVLITIGALSAFAYSLYGTLIGKGHLFLFYETAASVITLVFLGNYLEDVSIQTTQRAIKSLAKSKKVMANMIAFDDQHQEVIFPVENSQLKNGDLILIRNGEPVPADCKILWGDCTADESLLTGESLPVSKQKKDTLIGGSVLNSGTVKAQVTAAGEDTVLSGILKMVTDAQGEKPPVQKMADRISAIFVPVVLSIALITILANYFFFDFSFAASLMRGIAVLVIACPCAMGLATPAAIAVGLGRAAKNGILFRNAGSLETFKDIKQAVFDKTGTLTTGHFEITKCNFPSTETGVDETTFKKAVYSLEKYATHPIGKSIAAAWKHNEEIRWQHIEEVKGMGMVATDTNGDKWVAGPFSSAEKQGATPGHNVYIKKNDVLLGWIDVADEFRPEAQTVINYLKSKNIRTILLSGDRKEKCEEAARLLGIDEIIPEQKPEEKLQHIARLSAIAPTAMIGDGINDAPALAKATLGISLSDASQIALQSADVILMKNGLKNLPLALGLGKHTYLTIKQNLFWAFLYNIVAIPIAAIGLLTPTFGALVMGLSDVVLAANSGRLFIKKVT